MRSVNRRFHCHECNRTFETDALETVLTATCPNCKPVVALLERFGLSPNEAVFLTLLGVGVFFLTRN